MLGLPPPPPHVVTTLGGPIDEGIQILNGLFVEAWNADIPIAWRIEHGGSDPMKLYERTNVNGGAVALGHPLGASGARLMTTLVHELVRSGGRYALQSMCEGGGMANGTIIEAVA